MKTRSFCQISSLLASAAIVQFGLAPTAAHAQCADGQCFGTFVTVPTYDEQTVNMNALETEFATNNITLADFRTAMATAYGADTGGVINFDTIQDPIENGPPAFGVLFGQNLTFDMVVSRTNGGAMNTNSNSPVTSGANYLGFSGGPGGPFNLSFSTPLSLMGVTITDRTGSNTGVQSGNMTIVYDDATTYDWGGPVTTMGDTFVAHQAPVGKAIVGLNWVGGLIGSAFIRLDDLGFVAANFVPGDANDDGLVNILDYGIIRDNLGQTGVNVMGDVRANGVVDLNDFKLWKKFYNPASDPSTSAANSSAVPEPTTLGLLAIAAAAAGSSCMRRRQF